MNEEEAKLEILGISESIGLTFEGFDLVVEALEWTSGDPMFKEGEDVSFVSLKDRG